MSLIPSTDDRRGWHIEKTISYSDIIQTLVMLITITGIFLSVDRRIEKNAADVKQLTAVLSENDKRQDQQRERIEFSIGKIESKTDRIFELLIEQKKTNN